MLKRIRIQGYKSLPDVAVKLSPLTLLFGPNAAGKSNFLDALQLLSKLATSRTLKEAFGYRASHAIGPGDPTFCRRPAPCLSVKTCLA